MTILQVTPRDWWGAKKPTKDIEPMKFPITNVFFTYTKGPYGYSDLFCYNELKRLQEHHKRQNASDIVYNFVIAGSGKIYEGRGWNVSPKLAKKFDQISKQSVFIAYMGIFKGTMPTPRMMKAGDWLILLGMRRGLINKKFVEYHITATGYEGYTPNKDLESERLSLKMKNNLQHIPATA